MGAAPSAHSRRAGRAHRLGARGRLVVSNAEGHSDGSTRLYDLAALVLVVAAGVVRWLVTRWTLDGVTLRIESGLLRRDSRQLPLARIQAVDVVRPFLARLFGLAELRIRLAGSGSANGRLAYLSMSWPPTYGPDCWPRITASTPTLPSPQPMS